MNKRVMADIKRFKIEYPDESIAKIIIPNEEKLNELELHFKGPKDTDYESHNLILEFNYPVDYPFKSPKVIFKQPIYHPNVSLNGEICIDILKDKWTPAMTTLSTFLSINSLICNPQPDSALNGEAGMLLMKNNMEEYKKKVQITYERVINNLPAYIS